MNPRIKEAKDPLKLVRSGVFALERKKWSKARRKFEAALIDDEVQQNAGVWANYGIALTNLNLISEAQKAFTKSVSLDKKNARLWVKKGITESRLGNDNEAKKSFEQALRFDKKDPEIPILLSRVLRKQEDTKKAIKVLESAWKKLPESSQIPIELAIIYNKQNDDRKSEEILTKAIQTARQPDPGLLLGQTLLDKKDYKRSILIYQEILSRFPQSHHAQYGLGVAYHANEDWKKALEEYQKAIPLFRPEKPPQSLFINMGRVLKNLRQNKEAIDALYRAKKYGKPTLEISLLLAELFLESNRPDRAKRALEDAIRIEKNNPVIRFYLGLTLLQLNDIPKAKENFQKSIELDPDFHESKLQLSRLAIQERDFKIAYALANEVAVADPNHIPGNRLAAKLAYDLRNFKRTIELLEPVVTNNPRNHLEDLELILNSWLLLSQPEKAKSFLKRLLEEDKSLKDHLRSKAFFTQFF
ncbi:MAG: tetratricopeptide repeat protein [Candidatus Heimdallarchaeota archaeon]|nr:MAG: tetratricopeptide repeat protein [Candidatus Heimdallarchaeota archaeon]